MLTHFDAAVVRQVGSAAAIVHAVLTVADELTMLSHNQIAALTGLNSRTVRRCLARLFEAGLVKSQPQYCNNRQLANCYAVPTDLRGGHPDQGGQAGQAGHNGQAISTYLSTTTTSSSSSSTTTTITNQAK